MDEKTFVAENCRMLPYEVVVRREAHGSFLKRYPNLYKRGDTFSDNVGPLVEFFLKTQGKRWKQYSLPADDPLMLFNGPKGFPISLYHPGKPFPQEPFLRLPESEIFSTHNEGDTFYPMYTHATDAFKALERAWKPQGKKIVDYKVEFGINPEGKLVLADVIDNDSWRLLDGEEYIDKQVYRDGGDLNTVTANYRQVAELTKQFRGVK